MGLALVRDGQNSDVLGKLNKYEAGLFNAFTRTLQMILVLQGTESERDQSFPACVPLRQQLGSFRKSELRSVLENFLLHTDARPAVLIGGNKDDAVALEGPLYLAQGSHSGAHTVFESAHRVGCHSGMTA
jgi:hypothetical protein